MFNAIRKRLLAWNFVVLAALLVALGVSIYFITARTLYGEVNRNLRESAQEAFDRISSTPGFPHLQSRRSTTKAMFSTWPSISRGR